MEENNINNFLVIVNQILLSKYLIQNIIILSGFPFTLDHVLIVWHILTTIHIL